MGSALVIDGAGKFITPGLIDCHSHSAASSINEGAQAVTAEVRIQDVLNGDDINNVLDVVLLVNCILGDSCEVCAGDMNLDGILNVLDVVLLVNSILG